MPGLVPELNTPLGLDGIPRMLMVVVNGEVVTMDGGEGLKGAGQFNALEKMPNLAWKAMDLARKRKK